MKEGVWSSVWFSAGSLCGSVCACVYSYWSISIRVCTCMFIYSICVYFNILLFIFTLLACGHSNIKPLANLIGTSPSWQNTLKRRVPENLNLNLISSPPLLLLLLERWSVVTQKSSQSDGKNVISNSSTVRAGGRLGHIISNHRRNRICFVCLWGLMCECLCASPLKINWWWCDEVWLGLSGIPLSRWRTASYSSVLTINNDRNGRI